MQKLKGMSLIELLTVVIIITIVAGVSAPFLGDIAAKYQAESAGNHGLAIFKLCRIEALKRHQPVTCSLSQSEQSVMVQAFLDTDNNKSYSASADELIKQSSLAHINFISIQPTEGVWVYNAEGLLDFSTDTKVRFCPSNTKQKPLDLNLETQGVTYLRESEDACI